MAIDINNKELKGYVRKSLKNIRCKNKTNKRFHQEQKDGRNRDPFQRDYARVLYSSSFRRLQGKMQLLGVNSEQFYRNRLTHSLEVAQIARQIAAELKYGINEIALVEACALAHDIGNPPFGHYGEKVLNSLSQSFGGFEGNAQTLRVLMKLEKKKPNIPGLNLTKRTLLGVVKYFKKYEKGTNKKFIYDEEYDILSEEAKNNRIDLRTLDVQIIDLADEIAYAAHDLEDSLSLKLFSVEELMYEFEMRYRDKENFKSNFKILQKIVNRSRKLAKRGCFYGSSEEYSFLFRKELSSFCINKLLNDIGLVEINKKRQDKIGTAHDKELGFKTYNLLSEGLKTITFECINRANLIKLYEKQGEKILRGLYKVFTDTNYNKDFSLLPVEFRPLVNASDVEPNRMVIDYIAGMMDKFALSLYKDFYGESELEKFYFDNTTQKALKHDNQA